MNPGFQRHVSQRTSRQQLTIWLVEAKNQLPGPKSVWSRDATSKVCLLCLIWDITRAKFDKIPATAQATVASIEETLETYASLIPWLNNGKLSSIITPQFLNWSESLLGKGALLASEEASKGSPYSDPRHVNIALRLLRLWAAHPSVKQGTPVSSNVDDPTPASRASVWTGYYAFLTAVLQDGLIYTGPNDGPDRPQQASELRRVETICEGNLLREVKFPTASSHNSQVEQWVEQVIGNWEVLCGPEWQDSDLGKGGQTEIGRNVLDVSSDLDVTSFNISDTLIPDLVSCCDKDLPFPFGTSSPLSCPFCLGGLRPRSKSA
jgi:hypothetical protein